VFFSLSENKRAYMSKDDESSKISEKHTSMINK